MQLHSRRRGDPVLGETRREVIGRRADGSTFAMELVLTQLDPTDSGCWSPSPATSASASARRRSSATMADHDPLTGLINRRSFEHELTRHVDYAARYGGGGSVLALDIDNFKYVNETLGPRRRRRAAQGRRRADRAAACARPTCSPGSAATCSRSSSTAPAGEGARGRRGAAGAGPRAPVRDRASSPSGSPLAPASPRSTSGRSPARSCWPRPTSPCTRPRRAGRDRVVEYTAEGAGEHRASGGCWSERVRQATERGLFVLVCQPIVDLATGEVTQYELLLRMRGEDGGLVPAGRLPRDGRALRADPGQSTAGSPSRRCG